jgi:acetyl esterase/lipase
MPIGYLFSVALLAFCTAVAVVGPRPAHTTPSYWGFWATFLINEQPFVALYLLVADSVLAFVQGDLASPGGLAAFAVAVLTAAGLAVLVRRALATGAVLRRALADGAGVELVPARRPWAHIMLAPLVVRRREVTRVRDIAYGDAARRHLLDVYHRRDRPTGGGVLVYWHGGGFRSGHKNREGRAVLNHLAAQGWVSVSANYRLEPAAHFPDYLVDAKQVVAVGYYGYYGRVSGTGSSPLDRLHQAPPFLFLHGDKDSSTLVEDTREFVARLREASTNPVLYAELPGAQHTFDLFYSLRYSQVIEAVAAFCAWLRATQPQR